MTKPIKIKSTCTCVFIMGKMFCPVRRVCLPIVVQLSDHNCFITNEISIKRAKNNTTEQKDLHVYIFEMPFQCVMVPLVLQVQTCLVLSVLYLYECGRGYD